MTDVNESEMKNVEENQTHEPVAAAAAEEAPLGEPKRFGMLMFLVLSAATTAMIVAGTATYWFRSYQPGTTTEWYLYEIRTYTPGQTVTSITDICTEASRRLQAAQVFSIISSIVIGVSFALAVVYFFTGKLRFIAVLLAGVTILTTLFTWTLGLRVYLEQYCYSDSLKGLGYDLGPGPFLFFISTVLLIVAVLGAIFDPPLPQTKGQIRFVTSVFFMIAGFVSLLLCTLGCGLTIWKYRSSSNSVTEVTIWKTVSPTATTSNLYDIDCYDLAALFKAAAAFSILSIMMSLACWIIGFIRMFHKISVVVPLAFGAFTSLSILIVWAVLSNIWYRRFCSGADSYEQSFYTRTPAYGFFVTSFCEVLLSTLVVLFGSIKNKKTETTFPLFTVLLVISTFLATLFGTVSLPTTYFARISSTDGAYIRIYLWFADQLTGNNAFTHNGDLNVFFNCEVEGRVFKAVRYLELVGVIFAGVSTIFAFFIFKAPGLRFLLTILNIGVFALYTAALILWIISFNSSICDGQSLADQGFGIMVGPALQIIGWALSIYGVVFPFLPSNDKASA